MTDAADIEVDAQDAPIHRVKKAYEQVHDQLRDLIVRGELPRGQRLPNEAVLARQFGVSRGTVREALRVLAAQNLIRTAKGAGGGSFVTLPTVDHVSEFLTANIALLNESQDVSAEEMLEARELLETFAAGRAASRRTDLDLERLRSCIVEPGDVGSEQQFALNTLFHSAILDAAGNTLLRIAGQPIFGILQTNMRRREIRTRHARPGQRGPPSHPRRDRVRRLRGGRASHARASGVPARDLRAAVDQPSAAGPRRA